MLLYEDSEVCNLLYLIYEGPSVRPEMFIRNTVVEMLLVFKNLRMPALYYSMCKLWRACAWEPACSSHTEILWIIIILPKMNGAVPMGGYLIRYFKNITSIAHV